MQVTYLVRTPFGDDGEGFHKAMKRIPKDAFEQLGFTPKWSKGRDKKNGRYHYWEVENKVEAYALLLAFGDQIQEKEVENEGNESVTKNMVKEQGKRNDYRTTTNRT
jgi:hypothetical protein